MVQINDLADDLLSNVKLFAADTLLLFVVHLVDSFAGELYNYLAKISNQVHQWKKIFTPDSIKEAQDFIFNREVNEDSHLPLTFDNNIIYQAQPQKHLSIILDNLLSFEEHLNRHL